MIAIDTNVLVRIFIQDDSDQTRQAITFIRRLSSTEPGWVGPYTLLEMSWVLLRIYGLKREQVIQAIEGLLSTDPIVMDQPETVRAALSCFRKGKADFADCLIAASARAAGCTRTVTFDKIAARDAGMELIA